MVIIETVGVGQDEIDIVQASHTTVVVSAPGLGDDIQAIKAGILEIADIHVVSKADRADSAKTVSELKNMLGLGLDNLSGQDWVVPVNPVSSISGEGLSTLMENVIDHRKYLDRNQAIEERTRKIVEFRVLRIAKEILQRKLLLDEEAGVQKLIDRAINREVDPFRAAEFVLSKMKEVE